MINAILRMYPGITVNDFLLQDDGDGVYIKQWNWNEPQPNIEDVIAESLIIPISQRKAEKQSEIDALEASQYMTRGEREGWLAMIEAQATAQGVQLDLLYTANPFYKKLKDVDTAVSALRAELKAIV